MPGEMTDIEKLIFLKKELVSIKSALKELAPLDEISVSNFDEVKIALRREFKGFIDKFSQLMVSQTSAIEKGLKESSNVKVVESKGPRITQEFRVPDVIKMPDFTEIKEALIDVAKLLNEKEFSPIINVETPDVNIPEIKVPEVNISPQEVKVEPIINLSGILNALKPLKYLSDKSSKPISVRISDGKNFIKILRELADKQERTITAYSQTTGLTKSEATSAIKASTTSSGIGSNRKTVASAGTAVQLVASATACYRVDLSADLGNDNPVVIGGADVVAASDAQKGIVLIPGNDPYSIYIDDVSKLYVDAQTNGDSVTFNYYTR